MNYAIFVLLLGNKIFYPYCLETIVRYANRYNISLILGTTYKICYILNHFEKLQCLDYLQMYDRVLCLDADVLITPYARNIFEIYPDHNYLYAFNENIDSSWMNRDPWIEDFHPTYSWPAYNERRQYFNSGCVIFSKGHEKISHLVKGVKLYPECFTHTRSEQTVLNCAVAEHKIPFKSIDYCFNRMDLGEEDIHYERYKADFIHYAGPCKYGSGNKIETMKQDFYNLYGNE